MGFSLSGQQKLVVVEVTVSHKASCSMSSQDMLPPMQVTWESTNINLHQLRNCLHIVLRILLSFFSETLDLVVWGKIITNLYKRMTMARGKTHKLYSWTTFLRFKWTHQTFFFFLNHDMKGIGGLNHTCTDW